MKIDNNVLNILIKDPKKRLLTYGVYALVGLILGVINTVLPHFGITESNLLEAAKDAYIFLSLPFGVLAMSNTNTKKEESQVEVQQKPHELTLEDLPKKGKRVKE